MDLTRPVDAKSFCSLTSTAWQERTAWVRRELLPHALERIETATGEVWTFPRTEDMKARLEYFVALERECCTGSVRFDLGERGDALALVVEGIRVDAAGIQVIESTPNARRPRRFEWARACKAGGVGVAASALLFCGVPLAALALLGAGVAAPLAGLDHPAAIATGGGLLGVLLWRRMRSRAR